MYVPILHCFKWAICFIVECIVFISICRHYLNENNKYFKYSNKLVAPHNPYFNVCIKADMFNTFTEVKFMKKINKNTRPRRQVGLHGFFSVGLL